MKKLFYTYLEPQYSKGSFILLSIAILLGLMAALNGIADDQVGLTLVFLSVTIIIVSMVRHWIKAASYLKLILYTLIAFVLSVILHNVFEGVGSNILKDSISGDIMNFIGVIFFIIAVLICPPAMAVGIGGFLFTLIKRKFQGN